MGNLGIFFSYVFLGISVFNKIWIIQLTTFECRAAYFQLHYWCVKKLFALAKKRQIYFIDFAIKMQFCLNGPCKCIHLKSAMKFPNTDSVDQTTGLTKSKRLN